MKQLIPSKKLLKTFAAVGLVTVSCSPLGKHASSTTFSQASQPSMLIHAPSHIPAAVQNLSDQGKIPGDQEMPVTIALRLNNEDELDQKLAEMYLPGSPTYRQFMKPEDFNARYGPTAEQIAKVKTFLTQRNIIPVSGPVSAPASGNAGPLLIHAQATAGSIQAAFKTEIHRYFAPTTEAGNDQIYFAPASEPQLPADLPIQGVHGLQNISSARHASDRGVLSSQTAGAYTPNDIQSLYNLPSGVGGQGQTIALYELDSYNPNDISAYEKQFNLPSVPLTQVLLGAATGQPGAGSDEVTGDIEILTAIAPQAKQIIVYEAANNDDQSQLELWNRIANDDLAQEVSISWGLPEENVSSVYVQTESAFLKQMAAQGQSVFSSAGDEGAYSDQRHLSVNDPGSQPYSICVGGTSLVKNADGNRGSETVWNSGNSRTGASGGGVSALWTRPAWQEGISEANPRSLGSTAMRNLPDVSLDADQKTGYAVYFNGKWRAYGGTSLATPLWSGFTALANSMRAAKGLSPLGFLAPEIYRIARSSRYGADFFDITEGNNLHYPATPGYDNATGWGSFNGKNLLEDLSQDPAAAQSPSQSQDPGSKP